MAHVMQPVVDDPEQSLRIDLAAAFRLAAKFEWHESVANHFSAAISDDGKAFLLNPRWQHFSTIKASELLTLNAERKDVLEGDNPPDPSAWCIHGAIHARLPHARVVLHCHVPYATALCTLQDPQIKPIDQNTARFYQCTNIDLGFGGIAHVADEGARIAQALADKSVLLMGNHGVTVIGDSVSEAFDHLYYLERACRTLILAYSTGQPLNVMNDALAERTAQDWLQYPGAGAAHFAQLKAMLDREDPSYRD